MNLSTPIISGPPRSVPLSTRIVVWFSGPVAWLGWIFGGFGMLFVLAFVGNADLTSWIYFRGALATAPGVVTAIEDTRASEGGSKHSRGTPIYRYEYKFTVAGADYTGVSYHTGSAASNGQKVPIEYPAGNPAISRIQHMRRAVFGPFVLFTLIFPAIGFTMVAIGLVSGWRKVWLLANGEFAQARFTNQEYTDMEVNRRTVYKVWFEFVDSRGAVQKTFTRSTTPEKLEGEAFQRLLYDPAKPERSLVLATLPKGATPDERGQMNGCSILRVIWVLLPVMAAMVFVGLGMLLKNTMR